ncbi:hypothetical protein [Rahnella sp. PCH160]|uniref:hypothetical protein n=1 Tax=Rahnella sp. PCH160 TaxID=3447928 RepID=UPI0039FD0EE0
MQDINAGHGFTERADHFTDRQPRGVRFYAVRGKFIYWIIGLLMGVALFVIVEIEKVLTRGWRKS